MGEQKKYWEGKHFAFYTNKECEYYPCHPVPEGTEFNCLFCYCPLYMLGRKCGGNFTYLESGVKDCSECLGRPMVFESGAHVGVRRESARKSGRGGSWDLPRPQLYAGDSDDEQKGRRPLC